MRHFVLVCFAALAIVLPAGAQLRPFGEAHAIVGVRIEIGDGRVIEKGTVLIRDGLIEAVGKDLTVPPDAEVLKGDGLIIFPGFIDGYLAKGLKLPDAQPIQDVAPDAAAEAPPFMREANRRGVRPDIRAAEYLSFTESDLTAIHKGGFTSALIAPTGGAVNGIAALVNLAGRPKRESVILPDVGMCFAFKTGGGGFFGGGGYPATLLGVFAHIRQTLADTAYYRTLRAAFDHGGPRRPPSDGVLAALLPVIDGALPLLFEADTENEVYRAIRLADEQHVKPIIIGGLEAWKQADKLAARKTPVIVSMAFGDEPKLKATRPPIMGESPKPSEKPVEKPSEIPKPEAEKPPSVKPDEKPKDDRPAEAKPEEKEDEDAEMPEAARVDRHTKWLEKVQNAQHLYQAGVPFAFTSKGAKDLNQFWENLRRAIKEGLPREAALKALCVNPARLFGVERQMGTVEFGKIANLTVMTADFIDPKAKARYLFIDGRKFDTEIEPVPPRSPNAPPIDERIKEGVGR